MIIIGIDPGTTRIGFAALRFSSKKITPLEYGCWEIKKETQGEKLKELSQRLNHLIKKHHPRFLAVEKVYFFKNSKTAFSIAEAIGIIHLLVAKHHLILIELTPLEIKQKLVGYGRAEKESIQELVQACFNLPKLPKLDDTSDALAIALAGINKIYG